MSLSVFYSQPLRSSLSLSQFQPFFESSLAISSVLCRCFKIMSLVILPEQGLTVVFRIITHWSSQFSGYNNNLLFLKQMERCIK